MQTVLFSFLFFAFLSFFGGEGRPKSSLFFCSLSGLLDSPAFVVFLDVERKTEKEREREPYRKRHTSHTHRTDQKNKRAAKTNLKLSSK